MVARVKMIRKTRPQLAVFSFGQGQSKEKKRKGGKVNETGKPERAKSN